jgi:hypothetical protein
MTSKSKLREVVHVAEGSLPFILVLLAPVCQEVMKKVGLQSVSIEVSRDHI